MKLTKRGRVILVVSVFLTIIVLPVLAANIFMRSIGVWGTSDPGDSVEVVIPKGAGVSEIGEILADKEVIKSSLGFRIATWIGNDDTPILAGNYQMPRGMTAGDALDWLLGNSPQGEEFISVTFPEGSWLEDFAAILERETDLSADVFLDLATGGDIRSTYQPQTVDTLEGLVFPSTYQVIAKDTERTVLKRLVAEFDKQAGRLDFASAEQLNLTHYDIVIVASMIEAETFQDSERARIAQVIYNRLRADMPLGIDATVIYALGEHRQSLSSEDLNIDSPYNTRVVTGLPPTPIGAPGVKSLRAALNPAAGDWIYYVLADCQGHHAFSTNYDDFLADKAAYQSLEC